MSTGVIITAIICATVIFIGVLGFISAKKEREIKQIEAMKEAPKTLLDYIFTMGGNKNVESNHNDN
ncbi:MAG: hypothetical protein J6W84_06090 [Bacteroidales bacterium]|nr:hypothetical protein [Bacteroidales bacterium]